jgi:hypothetical protein
MFGSAKPCLLVGKTVAVGYRGRLFCSLEFSDDAHKLSLTLLHVFHRVFIDCLQFFVPEILLYDFVTHIFELLFVEANTLIFLLQLLLPNGFKLNDSYFTLAQLSHEWFNVLDLPELVEILLSPQFTLPTRHDLPQQSAVGELSLLL